MVRGDSEPTLEQYEQWHREDQERLAKGAETHEMTDTCPGSCPFCAYRDCPHKDEGHYWHDGCPSCWAEEQRKKSQ